MRPDQYVVIQRSGKWWISLDADRRGPYMNKNDAVAAAIERAKTEEHRGREGEVSWDDPADGMPTVYRSKGSHDVQ